MVLGKCSFETFKVINEELVGEIEGKVLEHGFWVLKGTKFFERC